MVFSLIRGTILEIYTTIYTHALMAEDIEDSFKFINNSFLVVIEFLERVKQDIRGFKIN